LTKKKKKEHMC